jgi:hypothetical protein
MNRQTILLCLAGAGTTLSWLSISIKPSLDLPWWLPLPIIMLTIFSATVLSKGVGLRLLLVSIAGSLFGLCAGIAISWTSSERDESFVWLGVAIATVTTALVSVIALLIGLKVSAIVARYQTSVWLVLLLTSMWGLPTLALTPVFVSRRVARNDQIAAERVHSLKIAVEQSVSRSGKPEQICNGSALRKHYSGPAFSEESWKHIIGSYVKEDGYIFTVTCREMDRYSIDAQPARRLGDGTRRFCIDGPDTVECDTKWDGVREACMPCLK